MPAPLMSRVALSLLLVSFVGSLVRGDEPAISSEPSAAKTLAELDPDTRKRFDEARERLRQAESERAQAARDADAADPLLATARQMVAKASKIAAESQGPLNALNSQYAKRDEEALKEFSQWQRGYNHQVGLAYFKRLAADPAQHALTAQVAEQRLKMAMSNPENIPPELQDLLPEEDANLKGDEALAKMLELAEAETALIDLAALEKTVAPTPEAKETVARLAEARTNLAVYGLCVGTRTAPTEAAAQRKCIAVREELTTIWPGWAAADRAAAR